jgi:putative transposase
VAEAVKDIALVVGEREACALVGYSRATFQRHYELESVAVAVPEAAPELTPKPESGTQPLTRQERRYRARQARRREKRESSRRPSSLALTQSERQAILDAVHEPEFADRSVPHIYAALLDDGRYLGSRSTMYRVLRAAGEVGDRRNQATRPAHVKPELCATEPGRVYCWDITKLHGPQKWSYYYLYVIIDIYSRYVVGWMVADRESSELAKILIRETILREGVDRSKLTIHADRGSSMKSKPVAFLLADLGVTKSHSRPRVSNDNPHIESHFKTVKYHPDFPATFSNIAEARDFCRRFFSWYNTEHRHSGIALLTPADVHHGRAAMRIAQRQTVLDAARAAHPQRFVGGRPRAPQLEPAVYINRPTDATRNDAAA